MTATLFPHIDVKALTRWLAGALVVALISAAGGLRIARRRSGAPARAPAPTMPAAEKLAWRMPPLALLKPVRWSPGLRLGMLALRGYLVLAAILLLVKAIRLGGT